MKTEIKKDYELRNVGNKIVLRQMCAPTYEMKTILVADEILDVKGGLFVLKYNERFFCLCREDEKNHCLYVRTAVDDYQLWGEGFLYAQNGTWHLWQDDFQVKILGKIVGNLFFALKQPNKTYLLNYFQGAKLFQKECLNYQKSESKNFGGLEADILKIQLEDGWRYVSRLQKTKRRDNLNSRLFEIVTETKIIFTKRSCGPVVDYAFFVCNFIAGKEGFGRVFSEDSNFVNSLWEGKGLCKEDTFFPSFNCCPGEDVGLYIRADLWQMFQGQKRSTYQVSCPSLNYEKKADDVFMGTYEDKDCLFVCRGKKTDKFVCAKDGMRHRLEQLKD